MKTGEHSLDPALVTTLDQSFTLRDPQFGQLYHSINGAITESLHVFIQSGLEHMFNKGYKEFSVFEMGFGTGLNALLTMAFCENNPSLSIDYTTVEKHPLPIEIIRQLNYTPILGYPKNHENYYALHLSAHAQEISPVPGFRFTRFLEPMESFAAEKKFNLVYYDAFAPDVQPELWEPFVFSRIAGYMHSGGVLLTYCAKGQVKRNLKAAGFEIEPLPGPPGKREITRATKI